MSPRTIKNQGSRNRTAGHTFERQVVKDFKDMGWEEACTTRYGSRILDDAGVDVMNIDPFYIQTKLIQNSVQYDKLLARMPKKGGMYNLVYHKRNSKTYVILEKKDFHELVMMLRAEGCI